jgi:hypothetical protein
MSQPTLYDKGELFRIYVEIVKIICLKTGFERRFTHSFLTNIGISEIMQTRGFVGREGALAWVRQHLADPLNTPVPAFIGRDGIGKTALLKQFAGVHQGSSFVGVYINCRAHDINNEMDWLIVLYQTLRDHVKQIGIVIEVEKFSDLTDDAEVFKAWFKDEYLVKLLRQLDSNGRVLFLIDNAEILLETMMRDTLAEDYFAYLNELRSAQVGVAFTLHIDYENRLELFYTIVQDSEQFMRLNSLTMEQTQALLEKNYTIDAEAVEAIYKASGGEPRFIKAFGAYLPADGAIDSGQVKSVTRNIYDNHRATFRKLWGELTDDERLVLMAIGNMVYDDPLEPITAGKIERWLSETEHPLELTTIHASIRGLEYRELLAGDTRHELTLQLGLLLPWILEQGALSGGGASGGKLSNRALLLGAIVLMVLLIALVVLSNTERDTAPNEGAIPTATITGG